MLLNSWRISTYATHVLSAVCAILLTPYVVYAQSNNPLRAVADLSGCTDPTVSGTLLLEEEVSNEGVKLVEVSLRVTGLALGTKHAVHIHETAACTPCGAAGGHFDPGPNSITSPDGNHPYHAGDLVNLSVDQAGTDERVFTDAFDNAGFNNDDGNAQFNGSWLEDDIAGAGPIVGNVTIANGALSLNDRPNTNTQPGILRDADLSSTNSATLSFDFSTSSGVDRSDAVTLDVSSDGINFTSLETFTGISGQFSNSREFDITNVISSSTSVRFRVTNLYGGSNEYFTVDNLTINAQQTTAIGLMQALTNRITLSPGPLSIFDSDGSAVIVHVDPDSYCPQGEQAGCAGGARAACGIIQLVND